MPGKDAVTCLRTQRHSAEQIVNTTRTARQWKALAELMASRIPSQPAPADVAQVVATWSAPLPSRNGRRGQLSDRPAARTGR